MRVGLIHSELCPQCWYAFSRVYVWTISVFMTWERINIITYDILDYHPYLSPPSRCLGLKKSRYWHLEECIYIYT